MQEPSQSTDGLETQTPVPQASEPDEEEDSGERKSEDSPVCQFILTDLFLLTNVQIIPKTPIAGQKCRADSAIPVTNIKKSHTIPAEKLFTGISASMDCVTEVLSADFPPSSSNALSSTPVRK